MKNKLLLLVPSCLLFLATHLSAQAPPLGTSGNFAVFTAAGAFNNLGNTLITGDVGTGVGLFTGFPPGFYSGQSHVADATANQGATDAGNAYGYLAALNCVNPLAVGLGNGQVITPGIYCLGAAGTLNGNLVFDAQGDMSAIFIIKVNGALSTGIAAHVLLANNARAANIFWQVNGQFDLGDSSAFTGTLIAAGAINLFEASSVNGRMWSTAGAISLHNNNIALPFGILALNDRHFSAEKQGGTALLRWSAAAAELNTAFATERSSTGAAGTWQELGTTTPAENTTSRNYLSTDNTPLKGNNYYRLKTTAGNGSISYSAVAMLQFDRKEKIAVSAFPNPVKNELTVVGAPAGSRIILSDLSGKTLLSQAAGDVQNKRIAVSSLATGMYIMKITTPGGESSAVVVVKL